MIVRWTTKKSIKKESRKYTVRSHFSKGSSGAYKAAIRLGILDEVCRHMKAKPTEYTNEMLKNKASKYETRSEFQNKDNSAYQIAKKRGILNKICSHMPSRNLLFGSKNPRFKYTDNRLMKTALKYKTKVDFLNNSRKEYNVAYLRGILDKICAHMIEYSCKKELHPRFKWPFEKLKNEAAKYEYRSDFMKKSQTAYVIAARQKILDIICSHMKLEKSTSFSERELFAIIKEIYPSAKKLHDRKVKIKGKPYIKGFDIDIFIPELNLGIEFDGTYYHSYKYMRKCKNKRKWSNNAIRNYHEIKDDWFMSSRNIKILHIKERDWIKDKECAINKCFEFLKGKF